MINKGILIITPFFSPNIGGVETHLDDLITELNKNKIKSHVLTYSPLTTDTDYLSHETIGLCHITRFKWFGYQLFPKLEVHPFLVFIYLTPYLLLRSFWWLLFHRQSIDIIHSQGFNAAIVGNILARVFGKKHLCSTHAIYENIQGPSRFFTVKVLNHTDKILCLSHQSRQQLTEWGIDPAKVMVYRYWIDLKKFIPAIHPPSQFTVLYVGRLIPKKGIPQLLKVASLLPQITFLFAGTGPSESLVRSFSQKHHNIICLGSKKNSDLPAVYHRASLFCLPSQYPEGYGRVLMEAVACGLPIVGSNFGSIPEAVDSTVSVLVNPTVINLKKAILNLYHHSSPYQNLRHHCRQFAVHKFSSRNSQTILRVYRQLLSTN